jgi:amino acid adenylation domain-containing protein
MVSLAAYQVLLSRWSGQQDIVVGSPIAGRRNRQIEGLIGSFVNTLVLRTDVSGNLTFRQLLERVKEVTLGAYSYQDLPFEALVKELRPARNLTRQPIFQVSLVLQNYPEERLELPEITWTRIDAEWMTAHFDLTLYLYEHSHGVSGVFEYATDLFDKETIERMAGHFRTLLEGIVVDPDCLIRQLPLLSEAEKQRLLVQWNQTAAEYPRDRCLHELFEEQAERKPDAIALVYEGRLLTYAELNCRANQLAQYLRDKDVGPDRLVAICVERSLDMVVGLMGILKAGGAYVPLDPNYPIERLQYMLRDAAPRVLLTQERLRERLPATTAEVITLDNDWDVIAQQPSNNLKETSLDLRSYHLAYVIYTSGSTGEPKGVMVEHRNVTRLFAATEKWFDFNDRDVWSLFHSFAFDFSIWELWGALLYGGRVVVVPYLTARSAQEFYDLLCEEGVTVLNETPSAFAQLIDAQGQSPKEHSLRVVIFGGEALELRTLQLWVERNGAERPRLVNMYGITETTVHVTYRPLTEAEVQSDGGSLIGKPIPDLKAYLLDHHRQPVPIGVIGEIYVGGAGIARGYLNRPELTAERFISDPFSTNAQARMYKTGDLGRWRADGTIEYLGRNDDQVKIRGFRIELGEIEAQLARYAPVKEVVVVAREDIPGEKRLVAYITRRDESDLSLEELREHLMAVLPEYMVPSAFVMIERFPLTPNGKLDRRALPVPALGAYVSRQYEAPQGEVEQTLAGIWQELLHVERVGRQDNFFKLGGHSLVATQVIVRIRSALSIEMPIKALFEFPTIEKLSAYLRRERAIYSIATGAEDIEELLERVASMPESEVKELVRELRMGSSL